ncbi:MAG: hypothetical protein COV67_12005 [Nitrospinae bacterium CG11_big_fil_rev_8_21_14_0_20_56_8]|nr:MAG: hypothetical protein COV67_12005 [Nitrospinae bacterium CG11_big_fil_rev_8_21_14_0_20_56_8]
MVVRRYGPNCKGSAEKTRLRQCPVRYRRIESGEVLKHGCGLWGLAPHGIGWRCLYCGNYEYEEKSTLDSLWFHFKVGREYWRPAFFGGREFVNGVPVSPPADSLPGSLARDLQENRPPRWFPLYICCEEEQFQRYLEGGQYDRF